MKRILIVLFLTISHSLYAFGTYSEGWAVIVPTKIESSGIIFDSYEGLFDVVTFDRNEKCVEKEDLCYSPKSKSIAFSVRPENAVVANFVQKNVGREMLVQYRIHRFTAIALSSELEITDAKAIQTQLPADAKKQVLVKKSGSKRSFSVYGKILQFEYRGRFIGTYEGIYYDKQRDKVHQFSVTNEEIAKQLQLCMQTNVPFYFGVTVSYVTAWRESDYDVFEINYDGPAGQAKVEPTDDSKKDAKTEEKAPEPAK